MSAGIVAIVLAAALLHALWNALVKGAGDKTIMLGLIALGHVVPGVVVALAPSPGWAVRLYIVASTVVHWGYYYFLNVAYHLGDLRVMYPIARGLAPALIALGHRSGLVRRCRCWYGAISLLFRPGSWR